MYDYVGGNNAKSLGFRTVMLNGCLVTHTQPVKQDSFLNRLPTLVQSNGDNIQVFYTKQYTFTSLNRETSTNRYFIDEKIK